MHTTTSTSQETGTIKIIIEIAHSELSMVNPESLVRKALQEAATGLATTYLEENKMAILEKISPVAVANLAIADSAKLVRQQFIDPEAKKK